MKPQKIVISGKLANYFLVLKSMCFFFKQFTNRNLPYKKVLLNFGTLDRVQSNLITVNTGYTYNEFMLTGNSFSLLLTIYYKLNRNEIGQNLNES